LAGKLFVVMGAGGAGKALAYGAYEKGARVVVANRTYGEKLYLLYHLLCS
jgi:3-dehydroquinate dehydratase/shikimate dehydrogenase